MFYVSKVVASIAALLLSGGVVTAQLLPPVLPNSDVRKWTGGAGGNNTAWATVANWDAASGGVASGQSAHALFAALAAERANVTGINHTLASLWFDAGTFYDFAGTQLELRNGNGSNGYLLVVRSDGTKQSEINLNLRVKISDSGQGPDGFRYIRNYSEGGLRFGGLFMLGDRNVRFGGSGAIHIADQITNQDGNGPSNGNIQIEGSAAEGTQPHVVFSGNNANRGGKLDVNNRGFAIVKSDQAVGSQADKYANFGGTIGFRSHLEAPLTYTAFDQNNYFYATGLGIVRRTGTQPVGAIYNDGGRNLIHLRIGTNSDSNGQVTGLGSRGDRAGGLELRNYVGGSSSFLKLGPGLIVLNNTSNQANQWNSNTTLQAGVLRIGSNNSLPAVSLVFAGGIHGGILELGAGNFTRGLGTGNNQMRWTGSGGFSAFGGNRSVTINTNNLAWGSTANFIGTGSALLLSSRYADSVITLTNAINLNGAQREVRVERGDFRAGVAAHAVLSGVLSGGGIRKTGIGLLRLTGNNTYAGATTIAGGALRAAIPVNSNLVLSGGVYGLDGNFSYALAGFGAGVRWTGSGGFAAYGGVDRTVTLSVSPTVIAWGAANFVGTGQELLFGHYTADGTVVWNKGLGLGDGSRTIRVERGEANRTAGRADVRFAQALTSTAAATLNLVGDGRIDSTVNNSGLLASRINIYGAELWLHGAGRIAAAPSSINLRYGGTLTLDDGRGSPNNHLNDASSITLASGTLNYRGTSAAIVPVVEKVGTLTPDSGANAVNILGFGLGAAELHIENLARDLNSHSTLMISTLTNVLTLRLNTSAAAHGISSGTGDAIIPWATTGDAWATPVTTNENHFIRALSIYSTTFAAANNVRLTAATTTLTATSTANSLILGGNLNIANRVLTLGSGGLLVTGNRTMSGTGNAASLRSGAASRPLYIHNAGTLTIGGTARFISSMDVVKTRGGSLILNSTGTHNIGSLYIHQGTVDLREGILQIASNRRIVIGDGAGTDRLILAPNRWNQIIATGAGRLPSITLNGTPYDSRGPEYGGDQAILQMGGNTKLKLANLHIENRGTIDWRGGEVGQANIIWFETLTFNNADARLFMRNWYEYEDIFLVRRDGFNTALLPQIIFEGYQDYTTTWKNYDATYIQITPFGEGGFIPEPSTYGAILGAVGLGLWHWRKRRRQDTAAAQ